MTRAHGDAAAAAVADPAPRPLAILHIIPTLGVGGTERQLVKLLPRLDPGRFRQTVCYYTRSETLEEPLRAAGIPVLFFDKFAMPPWTFFGRLRRVIREVRPDIVHTWLYSGHFWGRMAAVSCGVRTLVASDRNIIGPASLPVVLYERLLAGRTIRTANSRAAAVSLARRYGLPLEGIRVMANAVDAGVVASEEARRAARRALDLPEGGRVVLMAARQSVEKNHPMFFRVAARVGARRPDVTFIALGHQFHPQVMREDVARAGAGAFVRLVAQQEDVPRWLAASDLFCLTSNEEGLPNAVLEAMAAGVPVVCTDFASAREIVTDDACGVVVRRDDDAAMAEAILGLLADEERRSRVSAAGRRHVLTHFGWDRLVREMETLYEASARPGSAGT